MEAQILGWLDGLSGTVFRVAAILFVLVNAGAAGVVAATRSRAVVNRWTSPWLAANAILLGAGLGTPLVAGLAKLAVRAIATAGGLLVGPTE
jgi:hypothetical protein